MRIYTRTDPAQRFWAKVDASGSCWEWTASQTPSGYGQFQRGRGVGPVVAHRWAWEHLIGPIPEGLQLDHLCRNRLCVNPDHLEPVTSGENTRRGAAIARRRVALASRTHCRHGHEFTPENTYHHPAGERRCRECCRSRQRQWVA